MDTAETSPTYDGVPWEDLAATHAELSDADLGFRELARSDPELLNRETFAALDRPSALFRYALQSWPVFIRAEKVEELARLSVAMSDLLRSVPERIFDGDAAAIASAYGLPEDLVVLVLEPPNGIATALSRGDFVATDSGFQCVEFNVESNLGGWETAQLAEILLGLPALRRFTDGAGLRPRIRNTVRIMLYHVVARALEGGLGEGRRLNAVLGTREAHLLRKHEAAPRFLRNEYRAVLSEVDPGLSGTMEIANYDELTIRRDGVRFGDLPVHVVVERHVAATEPSVYRAFKMGHLHLYNGLASLLLSDKRTLAVLSEHAESDRFDAEERRLLRDHFPWARRVCEGATTWEGSSVRLGALAETHREDLVLKKAKSMGGAHVILGRNLSPDEWRSAWRTALEEGDWIVQRYVSSRPYLFQTGPSGCAVHDAVWGPFVFGGTYGGTILRVQPRARGGVVNLSRGATEAILAEVEA